MSRILPAFLLLCFASLLPAQTATTTCNVKLFNAGSFPNNTRAGHINRWHNTIGVSDAIGNFIRYGDGSIKPFVISVPGDTPSMTYRNAFGVTTGFFFDNNFNEHGFVNADGQTTVFDYPNSNTELRGINRYGTIVGIASNNSHPAAFAFVYRNGKFSVIDVGQEPDPATISDTGVIVGTHSVPGPSGSLVKHGFVYVNGTVQDVLFPGADDTLLHDINASGVIVGSYHKSVSGGGQTVGTFLIRDGQFVEAKLPGFFPEIFGINGFGEVVGSTNTTTVTQGFVGTCP